MQNNTTNNTQEIDNVLSVKKITKGEWKVTKNEYNEVAPLFIQSGTSILADIHQSKEVEANAKLIAASPILLDAAILCESISDRCNNAMLPPHVQELLTSINATLKEAINKATL